MTAPSAPVQLPAKSPSRGSPAPSLLAHLLATEQAALCIFKPDQRFAARFLAFFQVDSARSEAFLLHLRLACLLHDLGKANEDFVRAVSRGPDQPPPQTLRHEHLSAILLHLPELQAWLKSAPGLEPELVIAAVLSHHLKAAASEPAHLRWGQTQGARQEVALFLQHEEVRQVLARVAVVAGLPAAPALTHARWTNASPFSDAWRKGRTAADQLSRQLRKDPTRQRFLAALKVGLILSDAVASGLVRQGMPLEAWLDDVLHRPPLTANALRQAIIQPRCDDIARRRGHFTPHSFQLEAATQGDRVLLLAGCGTGKTLTAWLWAEEQARRQPVGSVIFLYPTRGTATEGFRDYVGWAPEGDAALLTGTSRYELERMLENPPDSLQGKDAGLSEAEERLFALAWWSRRYFSATVDQFLSFLEHRYQSLCLTPLLADCALIIDEVHSFDRRMFDTLVGFLQQFRGPVLCMTATLSEARKSELVQAGLSLYPRDDQRDHLADLQREEEHLRYSLTRAPDVDAVFAAAVAAWHDGLRVLWVVNTVDRCQALGTRLQEALGAEVLTYHSRFRLQDRQRIHARTVAAFQCMDRAIAVTTQVCEMSLDLDADLLITELAPVSSLVQRFGRSNRHRARGDLFRAQLLVYPPASELPYDKAELAAARDFLDTLGETALSQRRLAEVLEQKARAERPAQGVTSLLSGGYYAVPGSFREEDSLSRAAVLSTDVETVVAEYLDGRKPLPGEPPKVVRPIDGFVLSVPARTELLEDKRLPAYLRVADAGCYDNERGFLKRTDG